MARNKITSALTNYLIILAVIFLVVIIAAILLSGFTSTIDNIAFISSSGFIILFSSSTAIFIGMLIAPYNPKIGKIVAYFGVGLVMFALIFMEVYIIQKTVTNRGTSFAYCKDLSFSNSDLDEIFSCLLTGHKITGSEKSNALSIGGFFVFSFLVPLFILVALMADFVESSGVVQNPTYQKIIGFGLGFLAYRGFIVTNLIYILDVGATGMAVIALNFIFIGGVLSYVRRVFRQWQLVENEIFLGQVSDKFRLMVLNSLEKVNDLQQFKTTINDEGFKGALIFILGEVEAKKIFGKALSATTKNEMERIKAEIIKEIRTQT
ncbi:MAG: hypothetical protein N3D75_00555 [Candidatus Aenigmarchaeota archaeon]|nr:hypothetical protein [Candidatus Aenigmarchaeota archaeon]